MVEPVTTGGTCGAKAKYALKTEGLRTQVKVLVGGAPVTMEYAKEIGADGYSENANGAVGLVKNLVAGAAA